MCCNFYFGSHKVVLADERPVLCVHLIVCHFTILPKHEVLVSWEVMIFVLLCIKLSVYSEECIHPIVVSGVAANFSQWDFHLRGILIWLIYLYFHNFFLNMVLCAIRTIKVVGGAWPSALQSRALGLRTKSSTPSSYLIIIRGVTLMTMCILVWGVDIFGGTKTPRRNCYDF